MQARSTKRYATIVKKGVEALETTIRETIVVSGSTTNGRTDLVDSRVIKHNRKSQNTILVSCEIRIELELFPWLRMYASQIIELAQIARVMRSIPSLGLLSYTNTFAERPPRSSKID